MKRNVNGKLITTIFTIFAVGNGVMAAPPAQLTPPTDLDPPPQRWLTIKDCLIEVERSVAVPVQETGLLESLDVRLNDSVSVGQLLAKLESSIAETELESCLEEFKHALDQANDNSDIEFQKNSLSVAEEELASYLKISNSVSESEIKRRKLSKEGAEWAVMRAQKIKDRARLDASRKEVAVKAAQQKVQRTMIRAPHAGVIAEILQQPGEWVQAGKPLLRISDMEHLVVHAHVPLDQINRAEIVGSTVLVESTNDDGVKIQVPGTICSYDHEVTRSGLIRLHAQVLNTKTNGHWQILPGKQVTLSLEVPNGQESYASHANTRAPN
jgi:multidrug efflux pump subunit AcrA (membrane-fusion protein)